MIPHAFYLSLTFSMRNVRFSSVVILQRNAGNARLSVQSQLPFIKNFFMVGWVFKLTYLCLYTYRRKNNRNSHRCSLFFLLSSFFFIFDFFLYSYRQHHRSSVHYYSVRNIFFDRYINNHCHITIDWNNYICSVFFL